ncbi:hypothetical protein Noda2021_09510 [Candidatus Dependentiae bacterium Noda2021]|nr:hypothetical protein Noda2021_09510 [Candidatus Dependentiae bacterium Noda2021]
MKKIIVTIVIASAMLSAQAMFMPAVSPMILLKLNKKHDPLSRKWLNEIFKEEGSIAGIEKVQRNFDHFYAIIKNHNAKLTYKNEHKDEIKDKKIKAFIGYLICNSGGLFNT